MNTAVLQPDQRDHGESELLQSGDQRKHRRFATRLKALYYVSDAQEGLGKCEIVDVSYGGLGIQLNQAGDFTDESAINLGVVVRWQLVPISLKGRVKWTSQGTNPPAGGVELDAPLDNMTLLKLL
jgi:hypothetical protein